MFSTQVRTARESDTQALSTLLLAGSADGTGAQGTADELDTWRLANAALEVIRRRIRDENTLVLVAEVAGAHEPVGLLGTGYGTFTSRSEAYLGGLYVGVRGHGVGRALLSELVTRLHERGAMQLEMTIAAHNRATQALASAMGFLQESEFTNDRFYPTAHFGRWFLRGAR